MRKELDDLLVSRYPTICRSRNWDEKNSLFIFGFDGIPDTWFNVIDNMLEEIELYILEKYKDNISEAPYIFQIKEKFNGLRIYLSFDDKIISDIIDKYESKIYELEGDKWL